MILNVFASWCAPCRVEHPRLLELQAQGIHVVGVAYKDDPAATRAFLEELGDPYALVLVDRDGRAGLDLGISGVPETYAVDAQGIIVAKHAGSLLTDAEVERLTSALR
jgi:cytochrome c biogenesis protein CcmG/thiol:disulfide interchange protein DsbE